MHCGGRLFVRAAMTAVALLVSIASPARACLWDSDTLRDERIGLPGIAEILTGRYERHSAFFYEDRVKRSAATIEREPQNLAAWDDLAVAYDKLGQFDRAIKTIERKAAIRPGLYETEANWGTFLAHRGDYAAGLAHLRRALEINPDAHFGREKYQIRLVEYLLAKTNGEALPGKTFVSLTYPARPVRATRPSTTEPVDRAALRAEFERQRPAHAAWAREAQRVRDVWVADRESAIEGIAGMVRFGTGRSPDLFAALGELLADRRDAHLAYRAFQRAKDLGFDDAGWIDEQMRDVSRMTEDKSGFDAALIAKERADAEAWVAAYQRFEDDLVRRGATIDGAALAPFYAGHGTARQPPGVPGVGEVAAKLQRSPGVSIPLAAFGTAGALIALRTVVRRRASRRIATTT